MKKSELREMIREVLNENSRSDYTKIETALKKIKDPMTFNDLLLYLRKETHEYVELGLDYKEQEIVFDNNTGWEGHAVLKDRIASGVKLIPFPIKSCYYLSYEQLHMDDED